jgi:hypothetical protein
VGGGWGGAGGEVGGGGGARRRAEEEEEEEEEEELKEGEWRRILVALPFCLAQLPTKFCPGPCCHLGLIASLCIISSQGHQWIRFSLSYNEDSA